MTDVDDDLRNLLRDKADEVRMDPAAPPRVLQRARRRRIGNVLLSSILVAAIGRAGMITRDFVKPGATVIDVGMNSVTDPAEFERFFAGNPKREETFRKKGSTLIGDVHPEVADIAGAMTPVPGGVGPLTIAMLMFNTVKAARMRRGSRVPELSRA